jgi:hypothetical protein
VNDLLFAMPMSLQLSRTRKVVVKKFKGKVFVDIREFWSKDGEDLPSKKGMTTLD